MIRVVLDTNVIVSALLQPLGPPAAVFLLVAGGAVQLCISGSVYAEYEEVIRRPRLARDEEVIAATLQTVREKGFWVRPTETIKACSDSDDDIFLECAHAASCGLPGDRQSEALSLFVGEHPGSYAPALSGPPVGGNWANT